MILSIANIFSTAISFFNSLNVISSIGSICASRIVLFGTGNQKAVVLDHELLGFLGLPVLGLEIPWSHFLKDVGLQSALEALVGNR